MGLEIGKRLRRCPDKDEVVDVGHMTRTVEAKVRRRVDAISRMKPGLGVKEMLVDRLGDENGMAPAHGKGGAARVQQLITKETKLRRMKRRQTEVLDHPVRKTKAVVEIVQVHLGGEDGLKRRNLELGKEIRSGKLDSWRLVEDGVGGTSIDDKTKGILVLGHSKEAVDDVDGRFEANHVQM
jgi:hypothetical protein